jgi:hypothetical protein
MPPTPTALKQVLLAMVVVLLAWWSMHGTRRCFSESGSTHALRTGWTNRRQPPSSCRPPTNDLIEPAIQHPCAAAAASRHQLSPGQAPALLPQSLLLPLVAVQPAALLLPCPRALAARPARPTACPQSPAAPCKGQHRGLGWEGLGAWPAVPCPAATTQECTSWGATWWKRGLLLRWQLVPESQQ